MARFCDDKNSGPILAAADSWRAKGLMTEGSVFSNKSLWKADHLLALQKHFVEQPDIGQGSFFEKLKDQLAPTAKETKQLAAEMLWLMSLCPSNVGAQSKREGVRLVWSWSGDVINADHPLLSDAVLDGVGSAGASFGVHRWRELAYFVRMMLDFRKMASAERNALAGKPWEFAEWLTKLPEGNVRQLRHMLLYLLFPDTFERIFGRGDRRLIVMGFSAKSQAQVRELSALQIDQELFRIRQEQGRRHPGKELDFYVSPLREHWKAGGFDKHTTDIEREHVLAALKEIDEKGIPPDAESTLYDLVFGARRYPPKVVLSLASKHASGEEFDREFFSGGTDSPAFKLLRTLGFHIERKDFVSSLLKKFLAQADAGQDLGVAEYPSSYRDLSVRVSFGKGNLAKVPWVSFLGYGQQTQNGIYPVFLYYKTDKVLILAYGISDTTSPDVKWPKQGQGQTMDAWFESHYQHAADRYGESLVFTTYEEPDRLDQDAVTRDLDTLVAEFETLFKAGATSQTQQPALRAAEPEPDPEGPYYSLQEAVEGLFISKERFEELLLLFRDKQNLILQGPPGVGKTYFAKRLAYALMQRKASHRLAMVQFHPSYAYEDFVQGYRPTAGGFTLREGIFYHFCNRAKDDPGRDYVFIIDEINRGNLGKVLGELLMLIEADKRGPEWAVPLTYGSEGAPLFFVPQNVFLLGLMNTADRSLAVVDYALRRRFAFVDLSPGFQTMEFQAHLRSKGLSAALVSKIVQKMADLNKRIADDKTNLGPGFCVGHSFFCDPPREPEKHNAWYRQVVTTEVAPLLREYWFDDAATAESQVKELVGDG